MKRLSLKILLFVAACAIPNRSCPAQTIVSAAPSVGALAADVAVGVAGGKAVTTCVKLISAATPT
jgi:hypothetical protein